jgi:hypothetical protein
MVFTAGIKRGFAVKASMRAQIILTHSHLKAASPAKDCFSVKVLFSKTLRGMIF